MEHGNPSEMDESKFLIGLTLYKRIPTYLKNWPGLTLRDQFFQNLLVHGDVVCNHTEAPANDPVFIKALRFSESLML